MPAYRFSTAFKIARGARAFVNLEGGVTRGAVPEADRRAQIQRLRDAEKRVEKMRQRLDNKNREIARLRERLSSANGSTEANREGPTPSGSERQDTGALPDFVIIGGKKCGTTYLYNLLSQHPYVAPAVEKEVHYFDARYAKGIAWYRSQFPPPQEIEGRKAVTGEATPYYLYHPHAARRAAETVPQAKLIALLRDPIDRAYSDYHHRMRRGNESLTFEEAIEAEEDRIRGEKEKMLADEGYKSRNYRAFSYLSRGIYIDQILTWLRYFDREQLLILKSEDMFENTSDAFSQVQTFLGLPEREPDLPASTDDTRNAGRYTPINPATRQWLREYFQPHNERLYKFLGRNLGW